MNRKELLRDAVAAAVALFLTCGYVAALASLMAL
jgi:hypothetical protein